MVRLAFSAGFVLLTIGCGKRSSQDPAHYSKSLIVLTGATDIRYAKLSGTDQVSYNLGETFPAKQTLAQISSRLNADGWIPLKEDVFNPGMPTSLVRGWSTVSDKTPNQEIRHWLAYWKNAGGDILLYALQYSCPVPKDPNSIKGLNTVNVTGIFMPAAVFQAELKELSKEKTVSPNTAPDTLVFGKLKRGHKK